MRRRKVETPTTCKATAKSGSAPSLEILAVDRGEMGLPDGWGELVLHYLGPHAVATSSMRYT